jgi:hypothetical protein
VTSADSSSDTWMIGLRDKRSDSQPKPSGPTTLSPWWPAAQESFLPFLLLNLLLYGGVTSSRQTLTQALVADSLADEDRDAAFSV